MGIKLNLLTKITLIIFMVSLTACNTAEQTPQPEESKSNAVSNPSRAIEFDQEFYFRKRTTSTLENSTSLYVNITRDGDYPDDQVVLIQTSGTTDSDDITAIKVDDVLVPTVSANTFSISFTDGQRSKTIEVQVSEDAQYEPLEQLVFTIIPNGNDYRTQGQTVHTVEIRNDDNLPNLSLSGATITTAEGSTLNIPINITNLSKDQISVPIYIDQQLSTASPSDYTLSTTRVTFSPGDPLTKNITLNINNDLFSENTEHVIVKIGNPNNAQMLGGKEVDVSITDGGGAATYELSTASITISEAGASYNLNLSLTGSAESEIIVPVTITNSSGNPRENIDYKLSKKYFKFPAGTTLDSITITSIDDLIHEGAESFTITVGDTTYANALGTTTTTVNLTDNETVPNIGVLNTSYNTNEGRTFYLPISLDYTSSQDIVLSYTVSGSSTSGTDHSLASTGTITIPAGVNLYQLPIFITKDNVFDNGETLIFTLNSVSPIAAGNIVSATSTINLKEDNELASIQFSNITSSVTEGNSLTLDLTLSQVSEFSHSINVNLDNISTSASDFAITSQVDNGSTECEVNALSPTQAQVTFLPSRTNCSIHIAFSGETPALDEPTEHLKAVIQQPQNLVIGDKFEQLITVLDNDPASVVEVSLNSTYANAVPTVTNTINEGDDQVLYFNLDTPSDYDIVINYSINATSSAQEGLDFTISDQSVSIAKGEISKAFSITTINDYLYEKTGTNAFENIILNIEAGPSYTIATQSEVNIQVDEAPTLPKLSIVDPDTSTPQREIIVNENDIVNITFELESAIEEDVTVTFDYDDLVNNDATNCTTASVYKCAEISKDVTDLDIHSKSITIVAGTRRAVLSFKVNADNLYELEEKDKFRVFISSISSTDYTSIDPIADDLDIIINDIDFPSVARFLNSDIQSVREDTKILALPIYLSTKSEADVNYKIQIVQKTTTSSNLADLNDFEDFNTDNYIGTWDTDTLQVGNLSSETVNSVTINPALPYAPLDHSGTANIIYEGVFIIPAYDESAILYLEIKDDIIYEGNEEFEVLISEDDISPPTYDYTVNSTHNAKPITILESSPYPIVEFDVVPADQVEGTYATISSIQNADATTDVDALYDTDAETTNLVWEFKTTGFHQHADMTFDVRFTGLMEYANQLFTKEEYMHGDYIFDESVNNLADITSTRSDETYSFTIPAGSADQSEPIKVRVLTDYRFEFDETLTATITNTNNVATNTSSTHTVTISNDDAAPKLNISNITSSPQSIEEHVDDNSITLVVSDEDNVFYGSDITSQEIEVSLTLNALGRQSSTSSTTVNENILLNSGNSFNHTFDFDPGVIGDYRQYSSLEFVIDPVDDTLVSLHTGLTTLYNPGTTSYNLIYNLLVAPLIIKTSRTSQVENISSVYNYKGHTCTVFRGSVNCFGHNASGQLGRENTNNYGGNPGDDVNLQTNIIDLGIDQYGDPNFVKQIALGEAHTCALLADNTIKCWGDNSYGQLGLGSTVNKGDQAGSMGNALPVVNVGSDDEIVDIKAMAHTTCVQFATEGIKCWGRNNYAQAGTETNTDTNIGDSSAEMGGNLVTVPVPTDIDKFEVGRHHACVLTNSDEFYCWGYNGYGQVGLNSTDSYIGDNPGEITTQVIVTRFYSSIRDISLGAYHTCARYADFTNYKANVRCWGRNHHGELGLGRVNLAGANSSEQYNLSHIDDWRESNRTDSIGRYNGTYAQQLVEAGSFGGACTDTIEVPYSANETCTYSSTTYNSSINVDSTGTYNQFAQVKYHAYKIAAGSSYTCGVYDEYYFQDTLVSGLNIRCWGSNSERYSSTAFNDLGILNNIGTTEDFDSYFPNTTNRVIPYSTSTCNGSYSKNTFKKQLHAIGDQSIGEHGSILGNNDYVQDWYDDPADSGCAHDGDPTKNYHWGWVSNFQGSGDSMNFELNYIYSMNNEDLTSYSAIDLSGGDHHICAVMTDNTKNETTQINEKYTYMCWGANWTGQTGDDSTICEYKGGTNPTPICSNSLTRRNLQYSF